MYVSGRNVGIKPKITYLQKCVVDGRKVNIRLDLKHMSVFLFLFQPRNLGVVNL